MAINLCWQVFGDLSLDLQISKFKLSPMFQFFFFVVFFNNNDCLITNP